MLTEEQRFCTYCGQNLSGNARFCPSCGTKVPSDDPAVAEAEKAKIKDSLGNQLNWAAVLMLVYSVPFLIFGLYLLIDLNSIVDILMADPNFVEMYGFSREEVTQYFNYAVFAYLASSICGIVSAVLCWKRMHYWVALILCIFSVFTGAAGFLALFMGLFAFWMILAGRIGFSEYSDKLDEELAQMR